LRAERPILGKGSIRTGTLFGPAKLWTGGGNIEVFSAPGGIEAKLAAGDVVVGLQKGFGVKAKIEADGGNVVMRTEPTASMNLPASASWGRVGTKLHFVVNAGGPGKRSLSGTLDGGRPRLQGHASDGQVSLRSYKLFLDLEDES
jgi:hypothetical protein